MTLSVDEILAKLLEHFQSLSLKNAWGEKSLFYNPGNSRPNGTYFLTIKEKDGDNDQASNLNRDGIFRINFGINEKSFLALFNNKPARPKKGEIIDGNYNFTATNILTPHPIYGWMKWVSILNPSRESFENIWPLINESYNAAVGKFKV